VSVDGAAHSGHQAAACWPSFTKQCAAVVKKKCCTSLHMIHHFELLICLTGALRIAAQVSSRAVKACYRST
jgi:hypothetical protein